jgi:hypothetical protein
MAISTNNPLSNAVLTRAAQQVCHYKNPGYALKVLGDLTPAQTKRVDHVLKEANNQQPPMKVKDLKKALVLALNPYKTVKVNVGFLNPDTFKDGMYYKDHKADLLQIPVDLLCYSKCKEIQEDFDFNEDGFTFCELEMESPLAKKIQEFAQGDCFDHSLRAEIRAELEKYLLSWGQEQGIQGVPLLRNVAGYRNSDPVVQERSSNKNPISLPASLAHIDFRQEDLLSSEEMLGISWKHRVVETFPSVWSSDESYKKAVPEDALFINVWFPTNIDPSDNGLLLLLPKSFPNYEEETGLIHTSLFEVARGLLPPPPGAKFVTLNNVGVKNCVWVAFFKTVRTVHAAYTRTDIQGAHRSSLEYRGGFVIPPPEETPTGS